MNQVKTSLIVLVLSAIVITSFYIAFNRTYHAKIADVENFVAPTIDTSTIDISEDSSGQCPTDIKYDIYQLHEKYFKDTQELFVTTVIHYFSNSFSSSIPDSIFHKRISYMNDFFKNSGTSLRFSLDSIYTHNGKPRDNKMLLKSIESFESFVNKKRDDLREHYYGDHLDFHNNIFSIPNALNIYVYNDNNSNFSGRAGDIESNYFAVSLKYMHPELYTFEHEVGHCFGLFHTHTLDNSGQTHSLDGGDFICETAVTFPFISIVTDSCTLVEGWNKKVKLPPYSNPISSWKNISNKDIELLIRNVMSYTRHQCRAEFSEGQVKRMKKILENNRDLRSTIKGLDVDIKRNIIKNLAEVNL